MGLCPSFLKSVGIPGRAAEKLSCRSRGGKRVVGEERRQGGPRGIKREELVAVAGICSEYTG